MSRKMLGVGPMNSFEKQLLESSIDPMTGKEMLAEGPGTDIYKEVGRTYSSASEAFKDADYATPIWRCETRFERDWRIVKAWVSVLLGLGLAYVIAFAFVDWLKRG